MKAWSSKAIRWASQTWTSGVRGTLTLGVSRAAGLTCVDKYVVGPPSEAATLASWGAGASMARQV